MESVNNSGTFADISCPRLLVRLHLARFTGTLRISQGAVLKFLYFQTGEIAMASSNDQGDHLAPILMRAGKLKTEQMELARKQAQPGTSLARVLVQMGFLTSGELFSGARQQLRQIVGSVLSLAGGRYEIQSEYFPREITSLNVETRELLLDLVQDLPERSFVLLEVGAPDTIYFPALAPSPGAALPKLPKRWQDCAGRFSGPMTIHAFGQAAGLDDFAASKTVYGLHLFGLLGTKSAEPEGVPVPEEVSAQSPGESVGVEPIPGPLMAAAEVPEPEKPAIVVVPSEPEEVARQGETGGWIAPAVPEGAPGPSPDPASLEPKVEGGPAPAAWLSPENAGDGEDLVARGEPIRLEFKDPLTSPSPPARTAGPWGILSIMAGIAILVATFAWFVFLKGSPAPAGVSPAPPEKEATASESGSAEAGPPHAPEATQGGGEAGETGSIPTDEPSLAQSAGLAGPQAPAPTSSAGTKGPAGAAVASPGEEGPASPPPSAAEQIPGVPPFAAADRFQEARTLLDSGDFAAAAGSWLETTRQETKNTFTLQLAIACQEESVKKAARRTRGSVDFFMVPFFLEGRSCYRLCWGAYASQEEARAGKAAVPAFFLDEGGKPVVVSLGKLAPPERR